MARLISLVSLLVLLSGSGRAQSMQLFADRVQPLLHANELEKAAAL